jgi:hypothetical protein
MRLTSIIVCAAAALGAAAGPSGPPPQSSSLDEFQLPSKSVFDRSMPRYPNVWFYVDASLASSQEAAVQLVTSRLRTAMRLREDHGPFDNPEGCDFEGRLEHLQPWRDRSAPALQHAHAFHIRYYHTALARTKAATVDLAGPLAKGRFHRFAASAHYEVEHFNPNHADVESCPICGRTGEYAALKGNLVEMVHDPLGVELLVSGTIRGQAVRFDDYLQAPVGSVTQLEQLDVRTSVVDGMQGDRNTLKIALVVVRPKVSPPR